MSRNQMGWTVEASSRRRASADFLGSFGRLAAFSFVLLCSTRGTSAVAQNRIFVPRQVVEAGSEEVRVGVYADLEADGYGFQLALSIDPADGVRVLGVDLEDTAARGAEWSDGTLSDGGTRLVWGVVLDLEPPVDFERTIPAGTNRRLAWLRLAVDRGAPPFVRLRFFTDAGPPPEKSELIAAEGRALEAATTDGFVQVVPVVRFVRLDANGDRGIDIADPIFILNWLFKSGRTPPCLDAADVNDSGRVDIADPIYAFQYLFLGGPGPFQPYPDPGVDPTDDALSCLAPPEV